MKIFVAWHAPEHAQHVKQASEGTRPEELRQLQARQQAADEVWKSWAAEHGGEVFHAADGRGVLAIPGSRLVDLPKMRETYGRTLQSSVDMGVGVKMPEAQTAARVATSRGGDRIAMYEPGCERELEESAKASKPSSTLDQVVSREREEQQSRPMAKGEVESSSPAQNPGANAGFSAPTATSPDHSEVQVAQDAAPQSAGLEGRFHQLATAQDQRDLAAQQQQAQGADAARQRVAALLEQFRSQGQVFAQLKQAAPDAYNTLVGLVQGVIQLARALPRPQNPQQPQPGQQVLAKAEGRSPEMEGQPTMGMKVHVRGPTGKSYGGGDVVGVHAGADGYVHAVSVKAAKGAFVRRYVRGAPGAQRWYEAVDHTGRPSNPMLLGKFAESLRQGCQIGFAGNAGPGYPRVVQPVFHLPYTTGAYIEDAVGAQPGREQPPTEPPERHQSPGERPKADLSKAGMEPGVPPAPHVGKTGRHDVVLPVGSLKEGGPTGSADPHEVGKRKVAHGAGGSSWVEARAGQVSAVADRFARPVIGQAAHPASSLNPQAR